MTCTFYVRRVIIAVCSVTLISILLMLRLYYLSFHNANTLEVLSGQYTRKNTVAEREGFVYDANGELLSHKADGAIAIVNPDEVSDKSTAVGYLADHSGYTFGEISDRFSTAAPFTVKLDVFPDIKEPEGVYLYRSYSDDYGGICRHLLGYRNSDGKGMSGIFKSCEEILEEHSGALSYKYTADASGAVMSGGSFFIEDRMYSDGGGIVLTVNGALQKALDEICDENMDMGAVIVSELSSGNILALSSRPLYDGNNVGQYLDSEKGELINRAFALYTPGSVFKAAVAAAALEKDKELYGFEYECTGVCDVSGKEFKCHKSDGHGRQTMKDAFANSCNTYFINLMEETGFKYVLAVCRSFGIGQPSVIDGFFVEKARLPDISLNYPDAYKANFAFGQGDLLMSCVDILSLYSVCATGYKRDFSLITGICGSSENENVCFEPKDAERVLSEETVEKMREMMRECVENGTGKAADVYGTSVGGKTATAQSGQYKGAKEVLNLWFAGVFPIDNPQYAIVVLCDGNGNDNKNPQLIFSESAKEVLRYCDN